MGACPVCGLETDVHGMSNFDERVCSVCGWIEGVEVGLDDDEVTN